ncbi:pyruvate, water dikinase regulatory protein [Clostridium formicaceticum]|uniref:Putative pyruvate, phosphate dikinase regulatory protein n=1 Tax=Clostridium formicaceticum TaxID=1497 RepID=A0AAC9RMP3_9CLOT|nr:pyruvate, water dikinase regulatory protein [Clostridium formicaceticum]AOY77545.1 phosphoenolpyruvate synthase regulatory protein [Clostridium formicaceticum]ARE88120.1 Putative pyruvate, phosphate dikinase regulatory protein [Clostridium formicaceticum]
MNQKNLLIYLVSDSIGETAEQVAKAAISQFVFQDYEIRRFPFINEKQQIMEMLEEAKQERSIVVFTMVVQELKDYLTEETARLNIPSIDIMSPIIEGFGGVLGSTPKREPGLIRKLDEKYFKKVEAIEFAVKYDDGKDPRGLKKADIVLIGISRTSKTPLSMYLAHKNLKVANVPLVPEVTPPKELFDVPSKKIIGLTTNPMKLIEIRQERLKALGLKSEANYASIERILEELEYADNIMKRLGCPVIDVSTKAVEESASIILEIFREIGYKLTNGK